MRRYSHRIAIILLLLALWAPLLVGAQPSTFRTHSCVGARLPEDITNTFILDGEYYAYASDVLFVLQREGERIISFRVDTDFVRLGEDVDYVVRQPLTGDLYFTARDRKGHPALYFCHQEAGKRPKVKPVDMDGLAVDHPVFSDDGMLMVFSSTGRKGNADFDLWYCRYNSNTGWGKPHNMGGRVNTLMDERFPAICGNNLFFVSNGRGESKGHSNVFVTMLRVSSTEGDTVGRLPIGHARVQRLPWPFSTDTSNTYALVPDTMHGSFYLMTGNGLRITTDNLNTTSLWGYVRDSLGNPIADAQLSVYEQSRLVASTSTNNEGYYSLSLCADRPYLLTAQKDGYYIDTLRISPQLSAVEHPLVVDRHCDIGLGRLSLGRQHYYNDLFGPNASIELSSRGRRTLAPLVRFLRDNPTYGVDLTLVADLTADSAFNHLLTEHRLQTLEHYLRQQLPATVRLSLFNSCAGRDGCASATGISRLTAIVNKK